MDQSTEILFHRCDLPHQVLIGFHELHFHPKGKRSKYFIAHLHNLAMELGIRPWHRLEYKGFTDILGFIVLEKDKNAKYQSPAG